MKSTFTYLTFTILSICIFNSSAFAQKKSTTTQTSSAKSSASTKAVQQKMSSNDSLSYALGMDIGEMVKKMEINLNNKLFAQAITDVLEGKKLQIDSELKNGIIQAGMTRIQEEKTAALKKAGQDFLLNNKKDKNVIETPEGVQYIVLKKGEGEKPSASDTVKVHYLGKLTNGEQFDSSYDRGEPATLSLDDVVEGWKIGIPLMNVGSKYRFFIPYNLGYGENRSGPIPAYSTLIFEVELLEVKKVKDIESQSAK